MSPVVRVLRVVVAGVVLVAAPMAEGEDHDWMRTALRNPDPGTRKAALRKISGLGAAALDLAEEVAPLLSDPEPDVRYYAGGALAGIGACSDGAIRRLEAATSDKSRSVRMATFDALGACGPRSRSEMAVLVKGLEDPQRTVREAAMAALGRMGYSAVAGLPALVRAARSPDGHSRSLAVEALGGLLSNASETRPQEISSEELSSLALSDKDQDTAVEAIRAGISDADTSVRTAALRALEHANSGSLGRPPTSAAVLQATLDPDEDVRAAAATVTARVVAANKAGGGLLSVVLQGWEHLALLLRDESDEVRRRAASVFSDAAAPMEWTPALAAALDDASAQVREAAATSLGVRAERAAEAIPQLLLHVKDQNSDVRTATIRALAAAAAQPEALDAAQPALVAAAGDGSAKARAAAAAALGSVVEARANGHQAGTGDVAEALYRLAGDDDREVRLAALTALEAGGPRIPPRFEVLRARLRDDQAEIRRLAITAIGNHGPVAATEAGELAKLLSDPREDVRTEAATALRYLGPEIGVAEAALVDALRDKAKSVRLAAAESLGALGTAASPAVPALVELVRTSVDYNANTSLAGALGRIGPTGIEALEKAVAAAGARPAANENVLGPDQSELLPRALKTAAAYGQSAAYEVLDTKGNRVTLKVTAQEPLALMATWCPYSRRWLRLATSELLLPYLRPFKFRLLFQDEWPTVRAHMEAAVPAGRLAPDELEARLARYRSESGDARLFEPAVVERWSGEHYFVAQPLAKGQAFPYLFDAGARSFDTNALAWLESLPVPPRVMALAQAEAKAEEE